MFPLSLCFSGSFFFNWHMVALQCCVSAVQQSESAIHIYMCIPHVCITYLYICVYVYKSSFLDFLPI